MNIKNGEKGFTLIEFMAATAVGGLMMGILVPSIFQVIRHSDNNTTRTTAVNQIENTAHWLSADGQSAQSTDLIEGTPADTMTLYWTDWADWSGYADPGDFVQHSVTYSLVSGELQRNFDGTSTKTIAKYISDVEFLLSDMTITVTVESSPKGEGFPTESRSYTITIRPTNDSPLNY